MIDYFYGKAEPEHRVWFGINGFSYESSRWSPSREAEIKERGWYFYLFIAGYQLVVFREVEIK